MCDSKVRQTAEKLHLIPMIFNHLTKKQELRMLACHTCAGSWCVVTIFRNLCWVWRALLTISACASHNKQQSYRRSWEDSSLFLLDESFLCSLILLTLHWQWICHKSESIYTHTHTLGYSQPAVSVCLHGQGNHQGSSLSIQGALLL